MKKIFVKSVSLLLLGVSLNVGYLDPVVPMVAAEESASQERIWDFSDGTQGGFLIVAGQVTAITA